MKSKNIRASLKSRRGHPNRVSPLSEEKENQSLPRVNGHFPTQPSAESGLSRQALSNNSYVITNLREAITLAPLAKDCRASDVKSDDLGRMNDAWIALENGLISDIGSGAIPADYQSWQVFDAQGGIALPGLVDAHTHPLFAGSRADEFCMRLNGATYQDIADAGGGIQSTVKATRAASDFELEQLLKQRLKRFREHGVTSIEAKTGYGLSIEEELRHLRIMTKVARNAPLFISTTCLALHAVPPEYKDAKAWSIECADKLLPIVAKENLASAVDAFIEKGYFSVEDVEPYLHAAVQLGLKIRLHADEFSDANAALCAVQYKALSADHLQFANKQSIAAMADAGVAAILLPGTSLYTGLPYTDARPFTEAGCAVAVATDFNPGSCVVDNLRLTMTLAALHCKLSVAQAIAAITWVPATSLEISQRKGALTPGRDADILIMPLASAEEFVADLGRTSPLRVIFKGKFSLDEAD